jgi:hypothetical protein
MKFTGFLLLLAGWGIVLSALALLGSIPAQTGFVLAGIAVEGLGLGLVARAHSVLPEAQG